MQVKALKASPISKIFDELETEASINERDLCSYLDVGDKTIRNWRKAKISEARSNKFLRLKRLKEVVDTAMESALSSSMIRQLLVAPMDTKDEAQKSLIDFIRSEPESEFFNQIVHVVVENFKIRQSSMGHYVLNNQDFDRLAKELQSDREPSEAVRRARERYLQLKNE